MRPIIALAWLLTIFQPAPPAAGLTVQVDGSSVTVWFLNSDARYEDFVLRVAGHPDIPVHAPMGELQRIDLPGFCGSLDVVGEVVSDPPLLFDRVQMSVPCHLFVPLVHGAAVSAP